MDNFTYFWCLIIASMTFFFIGAYKNIVLKIYFIIWMNKKAIETKTAGQGSDEKMRWPAISTIVNEAILQKRIKSRSQFLWVRHLLIFSGFMIILCLDGFYTLAGHYFHHYFHFEYFFNGIGKGILKFGLEFSGLILFVGLSMGLIHRLVYAEMEQKYIDVNLVFMLWTVVLTGFLTEIFRFAAEPNDALMSFSFIAGPLSRLLVNESGAWVLAHKMMWILHVTITAIFFAYIPYSKFVHILAAPIGRSITQGGDYGNLKRHRITEGLL